MKNIIEEIVKLMLKSSDYNPYSGPLSTRNNIIAAIDLTELCKDFAIKGHIDEAMGINTEQWDIVINELKEQLIEVKRDKKLGELGI